MVFVPINDVNRWIQKQHSHLKFTDDLKRCEFCGRAFLTRDELLFHQEGCQDRIRVLYPKRKQIPTEQEELGRWLNL